MFKWTVTGLIKRTETVLKQNNTMDIYMDFGLKTREILLNNAFSSAGR